MADALKREVNKHYRCMEIDIDGVMQSMLLLKKKKYAALMVEEKPDGSLVTTRETKGLDLVRRDWCGLSKETGRYVIEQILSGDGADAVVARVHGRLEQLAAQVRAGELAPEQYVITKGLNKSPHDYPDARAQPHLTSRRYKPLQTVCIYKPRALHVRTRSACGRLRRPARSAAASGRPSTDKSG